MEQQPTNISPLIAAEALLPTNEERLPLGEYSRFVRNELAEKVAEMDASNQYEQNEMLKALQVYTESLLQNISEDEIRQLLAKENIRNRRIALLDLYLLQQVIDRYEYHQSKVNDEKPASNLEKILKRLANREGFDPQKMPWSLTGKDYPIEDPRFMFIDESVRQSEWVLLVMQYLLENRFSSAANDLVVIAGDIRRGVSQDMVTQQLQKVLETLAPIQDLMKLYQLIPVPNFDKFLTRYYPSGAFAVDIYVVEALTGNAQTAKSARVKMIKLLQDLRGEIDPDMIRNMEYALAIGMPIASMEEANRYPGSIDLLAACAKRVNLFLASHLAAAKHHTHGGDEELKTRPSFDPNNNAWNSMRPL